MNFPIIITTTRILFSIFILFPLTLYFGPSWKLGIFFQMLAFTDFFDGYIARKYNSCSYIGGLLDPLADKILFLSVAIPFLFLKLVSPIVIFGIILRDIIVMTLREYSQKYNFSLTPSKSAKQKTAGLLSVISLTYFYNSEYQNLFLKYESFLLIIQKIVFGITIFNFVKLLIENLNILKKSKHTIFVLLIILIIKLNYNFQINSLQFYWITLLIQSYSSLFSYFIQIKKLNFKN